MKKRFIRALTLGFTLISLAACQMGGNSHSKEHSSSSDSSVPTSAPSNLHTHTPGEVVEEQRVEATCLNDGTYNAVVYCTTCHAVLSNQRKTIPAKGHDLVHHDGQPATCTEDGWNEYDTCKNCNYTTYKSIPATGHVDIVTREENRVEPTCTQNGTYDLVYYCIHDGLIYKTAHLTIPALGHTLVHHEGKKATCTEPGYREYDECSVCGYTTFKEIPATGHIHLATRQENIVAATCETAGSYDLVTYCEDDDYVVSTHHQAIPALGHDIIHHDGQEPTTTEPGWKPYDTCSRCDYTTYEEIPATGGLDLIKSSRTFKDYINHNVYSLSSSPSIGTTNILVVPIWFEQSTNYILSANREKVRDDIRTAYFGTNEETGWRSVKTFYEEESHGALTMNGTVSEWYEGTATSKIQLSDYTNESEGLSKTQELTKTVSDWYFSNHPEENRKDYDCDGDGYLDGVIMIYAAPDYIASGSYNNGNLWAYTYWIADSGLKNTNNPGPNAFFWASYDFIYSSNTALERTGKTNYATGDTSHVKLDGHTFIHEMGHMFGLNDYYDYSNYRYSPAGDFSMQDCNVGGHDPYSSFALGWGQAYIPEDSITLRLKPFATAGEMIVLSPSWNSANSAFDEYLIIEYFTPEALNDLDTHYAYRGSYCSGTRTPGVRLWHVDARLTKFTGYSYSTNLITDPNAAGYGGVSLAMSNTYDDNQHDEYISPLGKNYVDYNELQLIRNNTTIGHKTNSFFNRTDLFKKDDTFDMTTYASQFVKTGKLNSGKDLGFTFTVKNLNSEYATIEITKL